MPYVDIPSRADLDSGVRGPVSAGELSYCITQLIRKWVGRKPDYATLAAAVGVLILTTFEFIRRVVNPYEDIKQARNGDVY